MKAIKGDNREVKERPNVPMHDAGLASILVDRKYIGYCIAPLLNEIAYVMMKVTRGTARMEVRR